MPRGTKQKRRVAGKKLTFGHTWVDRLNTRHDDLLVLCEVEGVEGRAAACGWTGEVESWSDKRGLPRISPDVILALVFMFVGCYILDN